MEMLKNINSFVASLQIFQTLGFTIRKAKNDNIYFRLNSAAVQLLCLSFEYAMVKLQWVWFPFHFYSSFEVHNESILIITVVCQNFSLLKYCTYN